MNPVGANKDKFDKLWSNGTPLTSPVAAAAENGHSTPAGAHATVCATVDGRSPANGQASPAAVMAEVAAPSPGPVTAGAISAEPATQVVAPAPEPSRVDKRRSRQLLDRALALSERGDKSGAMLACRQAIALTPHYPSGYAMMGLLLERGASPRCRQPFFGLATLPVSTDS